eukprot:scaffold34842_cov27-Phaeocystis_antarctica.AAC.1
MELIHLAPLARDEAGAVVERAEIPLVHRHRVLRVVVVERTGRHVQTPREVRLGGREAEPREAPGAQLRGGERGPAGQCH